MMRGARMQALRLVDLPRLSAHRRNLNDGGVRQAAELAPESAAE
jgi:hypothetical protein